MTAVNLTNVVDVQPNQLNDLSTMYSNLIKIGSGGTATVYKAVDSNGQRVAIKVLSEVKDNVALELFTMEKTALE